MEMVEGRIEEKGKRGRLNPHTYTDKREVRGREESKGRNPFPVLITQKNHKHPRRATTQKVDLHNAKSLLKKGEMTFSSLTASSSYSSPLSTLRQSTYLPPLPCRLTSEVY